MSKSLIFTLGAVCAVTMLVLVIVGGFLTLNFVREVVDFERTRLTPGEVVRIEEGGHFQVFIETQGRRPGNVPFEWETFTFTNMATGEVVISRPSTMSSYNLVNVNGRSVAAAYLTVGNWRVDFGSDSTPAPEGVFVLSDFTTGLVRDIFGFVMHIGAVSLGFIVALTGLILLVLKHGKLKKAEQQNI